MLLKMSKKNKLISIIIILFAYSFTFANETPSTIFTKEELTYINKKQSVNIGMISNFKPFSFIDDYNKQQGFSVELVKEISKISSLKFNIYTNKWNKVLKKFENKELDVIADISHTSKREDFTLFTKAYYEIPTYIFGLKNNNSYTSINDLVGKKVGISKSLYYKDKLINKGIIVVELDSSNEKAEALGIGKIDYFLASFTSGIKAIVSNSITNIKAISEFHGVKKEDLRFGIKKDEEILRSIIEKSLNQIPSEKIDSFKNKWILELEEFYKKIIPLNKKEEDYLNKKESINLCIDPDWMPFEKINENGKHIGLSSDYFEFFQSKILIPINLVKTSSWSESLQFVKDKRCDILSLAMKTPNRSKYLDFTQAYFKAPLVLITKNNVISSNNIKDLENKSIGIIKDFALVELIKKNYPKIDIIEVANAKIGLEKVVNSEIFGFIDSLGVISYKYQDFFINELKINGTFKEKWELSVATRKDEPELLSIFNKLVKSIPQTKKEEISNKYISLNYEKEFDYDLFIKILIFVFILLAFLIYRQYTKEQNLEKIKDAYNKLETILDTTIEAIIISKNNKVTKFNKEALDLFKYSNNEDVLGKNFLDLIQKDSKNIFTENFSKTHEMTFVKSDKSPFYALSRSKDINTKEGVFRVTSVVDLTLLKEKEAILVEQSKMISTGEMIQNIAHQWRQPLSHISTIATGIKMQKEFDMLDEDSLIRNMEKINTSAQYLSQTIDDFRNFFKPNSNNIKLFNIKDTFNKLNSLVKDTLEDNNINLIIDCEDLNIKANENLLIQSFLNIINNAKDAIKNNQESKNSLNSFIFIECKKIDNNLVINFKDSGNGIQENILNRIFELYFTTKHESQGTGIGLYMTYQIITKQLKGEISVRNISFKYNNFDLKGAIFRIKIPLF
ncbi:transporter substrate-binding domain-containing protein [Poseidonibacter sp.]|uniref:transporter substrate-binding domain-containing protein n=1 Tax=Poseidonibacter sp. TaxID=2321188 RepID=UPI003C71FCC8